MRLSGALATEAAMAVYSSVSLHAPRTVNADTHTGLLQLMQWGRLWRRHSAAQVDPGGPRRFAAPLRLWHRGVGGSASACRRPWCADVAVKSAEPQFPWCVVCGLHRSRPTIARELARRGTNSGCRRRVCGLRAAGRQPATSARHAPTRAFSVVGCRPSSVGRRWLSAGRWSSVGRSGVGRR